MLDKCHLVTGQAPQEHYFHTSKGELRSLIELRDALIEHGESFFSGYVGEQNHFANWVEHVFKDKELAESMRHVQSVAETIALIDDRLAFANLWLKYNQDKELMHSYLLSNYPGNLEFNPEFHYYENGLDVSMLGLKPEPVVEQQEEEAKETNVDKKDDIALLQQLHNDLNLAPAPKKTFFNVFKFWK